MTSYKAFHSQLSSIMEALSRAAVAEICELVDDGYAVLRLEITRSHREKEALRRKLELVENVLARGGHRGGDLAMLEAASEGFMDFTVEHELPAAAGAKPQKGNVKSSGRVPALEATTEPTSSANQDPSPGAAEEPSDPEVVLIKEEPVKEEANASYATDELLLTHDGTALRLPDPDDGEEGPSGMLTAASAAVLRLWDQSSDGPPERQEPHSAPGSPGAAGHADSRSSDAVFDLASASDCEAPLPAGTCEPKRGASLTSSLRYNAEPDLCSSSWTNQGLPSAAPAPHRTALLDKVSEMSVPGFPLALGLGAYRFCGDRRFSCSYCGKCFTSSRSLETRARPHGRAPVQLRPVREALHAVGTPEDAPERPHGGAPVRLRALREEVRREAEPEDPSAETPRGRAERRSRLTRKHGAPMLLNAKLGTDHDLTAVTGVI
ncbi:hypothetical protein PFLUV_G00128830 [Perca fluviatilis]|uniref:C2H2-type domain-containing protein n=1 Tax=Perca fluviatilis TaxID=8168 RepID=A0A6A5EVH5_PERFL|nr:hypothetical protein PFLUV_G00128830 [Perca fluviatilis]